MKTPAFLPCTDGARLGLGGAPLGNLFEAKDAKNWFILVHVSPCF
jgi:hypothetical protein